MRVTPKEAENMPAGHALNALILEMVFNATPVTDDELGLIRTAWMMTNTSMGQRRPMKVPLTPTQIEGKKREGEYFQYQEFDIVAPYSLMWPSRYSEDQNAAQYVVHQMRLNGWLYEFAEMDGGKIKSVRFKRLMWEPGITPVEIIGHSFGGTDELAICRAALLAMMLLEEANEGGWKTE